jgi:septum formation protein
LLRDAGIDFSVRTRPVDEDYPASLPAREVAPYLARKKAEAYREDMAEDEVIITADTTVVIDEKVLNKPADEKEAVEMIRQLSDESHEVITGVSVFSHREFYSFAESTTVRFRLLDEEEMIYYVKKYRPFDKAGAYAIQEWIGMIGIEQIEGSYFNVMGLPVNRLYAYLKKTGMIRLTLP